MKEKIVTFGKFALGVVAVLVVLSFVVGSLPAAVQSRLPKF